jgi:hypothetical protein
MEDVRFFLVACGWALVGLIVLRAEFAHPVAVGVMWLVGFVWLAGWLATGPKAADSLVVYWLAMLGGLATIGGLIALLSLPFS